MATEVEDYEVEEEGEPITTRHALRRAFVEAPSLRVGFITTVLLAILGTVGTLIVPIMVQQIVDQEVLAGDGPNLAAVVTQGASLDQVMANLADAIVLHLEGEDWAALGVAAPLRLAVSYETPLGDGGQA